MSRGSSHGVAVAFNLASATHLKPHIWKAIKEKSQEIFSKHSFKEKVSCFYFT